ncbi:MAG: hypothetical protein WB764_30470, partial [Xanthobacteraceae bacterium]
MSEANEIREQIDVLKKMVDDRQRGYEFENFIRQICPGRLLDRKASHSDSEQLDVVFDFGGNIFLGECKAKRTSITPGSQDWEDYELKLRKRSGRCIGIFFSLYDLGSDIYAIGELLNKSAFPNIIITGTDLVQLTQQIGSFSKVLELLSISIFVNFAPIERDAAKLKRLFEVQSPKNATLISLCESESDNFRLRYVDNTIEALYVARQIDSELNSAIRLLAPHRNRIGNFVRVGKDRKRARSLPQQLFIYSDIAGSGKTTFSAAKLLSQGASCHYIVKAANEQNVDTSFKRIVLGLKEVDLFESNKVVCLIFDSLD